MKVLILVSPVVPSWILQNHSRFPSLKYTCKAGTLCKSTLWKNTFCKSTLWKNTLRRNTLCKSTLWENTAQYCKCYPNLGGYPWLGWEYPEQWSSRSGKWHGSRVIYLFLYFQYFCVHIKIDIDCGKCSSIVNANISSYANTYEDVGIEVTVSNPNEKRHYCIFNRLFHTTTISCYDTVILSVLWCYHSGKKCMQGHLLFSISTCILGDCSPLGAIGWGLGEHECRCYR